MATHWKPNVEILLFLFYFLTSGDLKPSKIKFLDGFLGFTPPLNANILICRFFFNLTVCNDQT